MGCTWPRRPRNEEERIASSIPWMFRPWTSIFVARTRHRHTWRRIAKRLHGNEATSAMRPNECCYVQMLACGRDMGPSSASVLLFFDTQRYVFNVPEGFQRFCTEHKVKLSKVNRVFLTKNAPEAAGGLPGALLTMADSGVGAPLWASHGGGISLHGPTGLQKLVGGLRTYVDVKGIGLNVEEFHKKRDVTRLVHQDDRLTVEAVLVGGKDTMEMQEQTNGDNGAEPLQKKAKVDGKESIREQQDIPVTATYICKLAPIPGKFMPEKAKALNIPKGPLYGKLVKGEAIQVNGVTIQPEQVVEPAVPGPTLLIVDCPTVELVKDLATSSAISALHTQQEKDNLMCAIHLAPQEVVSHPAYREWIASFPGSVHHIVSNAHTCADEVLFPASSKLCGMLNTLHPEFFPQLVKDANEQEKRVPGSKNVTAGQNLMRYHLKPIIKQGIDTSDVPSLVPDHCIKDEVKESFPKSLEVARTARNKWTCIHDCDAEKIIQKAGRESLEVTFLGTGAAVPSKYRNVTSLYLNLFSGGGMLLDAGEGTLGQMIRCFGQKQAEKILETLSCIWISHIHADHHAGLINILKSRRRLLGEHCEPILVIGPRPLRRVLDMHGKFLDLSILFVDSWSTVDGGEKGNHQINRSSACFLESVCKRMKLESLESVPVIHCAHSFGIILQHADGWKFTFSGDTRPSQLLAQKAANSTLLVHEATFEDALHEEAVQKNHCTTREAVQAGQDARAFRTLLTHFSQRYPKIPVFGESFQSCTSIAFDMMRVNLADVPHLPTILPALKEMFPADCDDEEGAAVASRVLVA